MKKTKPSGGQFEAELASVRPRDRLLNATEQLALSG